VLQKFLFIGVGGSGGKTLRIVYDDLRRLLVRNGYRGPFPEAWQFVQIDVPIEPDGNTPKLPPQLPSGRYVGLAPAGASYSSVDSLLMSKSEGIRRHTAGWRPDASSVMIDPAVGAGQYRAVGRIVASASMKAIVEQLRTAIKRLEDVETQTQFAAAIEKLGIKESSKNLDPMPVIVSSIAGGSGSGVFLDVCDALRMINPSWGDKSVGVLYTPDVFDELGPAAKAGVQPNALAAVTETLAGYWNNEWSPGEDAKSTPEFPVLEAAGVALNNTIERRGPRYPILVGRSNGRISFASQLDVYRVVAKQLVNWVTSPSVQSAASEGVIGNWGQRADAFKAHDRLPISGGRSGAFSSMGFATVSLGRDVFATYASERLAKGAAERLLRGHWTPEVPDKKTPDAACVERADGLWWAFLEECRLNEKTKEANQIVDAVKQPERTQPLTEMKSSILRSVTEGVTQIPGASLEQMITAERGKREKSALEAVRVLDQNGAQQWIAQIQPIVAGATTTLIARYGAPVAVEVLNRVIAELNEITQDLQRDADSFRNQSLSIPERLRQRILSFGAIFLTSNPEVNDNIKLACDQTYLEAQAQLHTLCSKMVADFTANFMVPLRNALENGRESLIGDEADTPSHPSIVKAWANREIREGMKPAQNEVFLEKVETYPETFLEKVAATIGVEETGTAVNRAVEQVIAGDLERPLIKITTRWAPDFASFIGGEPPARAQFQVALRATEILERAEEWVTTPDTAIGRYVDESLVEYLQDGSSIVSEQNERLDSFRRGFEQALSTSLPLARTDLQALNQTYGLSEIKYDRWVSEVPFPPGHPAREIAKAVLMDSGFNDDEAERKFSDARVSRIDITTFFDGAMHPTVFGSLTGPIRDELAARVAAGQEGSFWSNRRARPLPLAVALAPKQRRAFLRGWFVARLLELVSIEADRPVKILGQDGDWFQFPTPILGPPVRAMDQMAGALLETASLALLDTSPTGPMAASGRVIDLGSTFGDGGNNLPLVLSQWIETGERPRNAPAASSRLMAPSDSTARREHAVQWCKTLDEHFNELVDAQSQRESDLLRAPRSWELRVDIENALKSLMSVIETGVSGVLNPDGNG
jgi:hypothetical protein